MIGPNMGDLLGKVQLVTIVVVQAGSGGSSRGIITRRGYEDGVCWYLKTNTNIT